MASAIVVKDATSPERIVEAVSLFLHRPSTGLGVPQRRMLQAVVERDTTFGGKTVLLVDDDMRNIYALSSKLEQVQTNVVFAQNGKKALEELASNPAIDVVLMDIMMPEMDGYQAMREIRKIERFRAMPTLPS